MGNWSNFLKGMYCGPVIRIDNEAQYNSFLKLIEANKLEGYEYFKKNSYQERLNLLKLNYKNFEGNSFLVENSYRGGFVAAPLDAYDQYREDPNDWKVVAFTDITKELEG